MYTRTFNEQQTIVNDMKEVQSSEKDKANEEYIL